jgi:hypothetical protein
MCIKYIKFSVGVYSLNLKTDKEVQDLMEKVAAAVRKVHPSLRFDDDVEIEVDEQAGTVEKNDKNSCSLKACTTDAEKSVANTHS